MFKNYRQQSRDVQWGMTAEPNINPNLDQINCGSMLRIADAIEKLAKNQTELIEERDRFKQYYNEENLRRVHAARSAATYRGKLTRLKREHADLLQLFRKATGYTLKQYREMLAEVREETT